MTNATSRLHPVLARFIGAATLLAALLAPCAAVAHSNEYLATIKGAHGGMLRMAEMYHFELVLSRGGAHIWVTDHGDVPQATQGAGGSLRLLSNGGAFNVVLVPAGHNELVGKDARIQLLPGLRGILTVTMKNEMPLQTRFVVESQDDGHGKP